MDFCQNVSVSSEYHQQEQVLQSAPLCSKLSPLDDLFSTQNTEDDVGLEWLSVFVEDCLSSTGNCLPAPMVTASVQNTSTTPKPTNTLQQKPQENSSLEKFAIPGKARSKRRRVTSILTRTNPLYGWSFSHHKAHHFPSSDPPLLQQAYWLADSELITPKKENTTINSSKARDNDEEVLNQEVSEDQQEEVDGDNDEDQRKVPIVLSNHNNSSRESLGIFESSIGQQQQQQPRRCTHCLSHRTPQWRAGPLGPKTLCNACGVRYKSGRLLPEYRPAKSPTFVSYLHSNSHKKVMEMRMASSSSSPAATVFTS